MIQFCEDFTSCRKVAFGRSFASKDESFLAEGDEAPCGHCDNVRGSSPSTRPSGALTQLSPNDPQCLRDPSTVESIDVSLEAYRALRIISAAGQLHATLTLPQACDLVRGLGKGSFATQNGSKGKGKDSVDVVKEAGAKVGLEKPLTEALLIRLLCEGYLQETFHASESRFVCPIPRIALLIRPSSGLLHL